MDEGVWEAACCVRPYLPELLGTVLAAEVDAQLSGLLNGGGGDLEHRLREVLNAHEATSVFLDWVIDDAPAFRPPGLSGTDKFACPGSDYVWYRPASGGPVPQCPTHQCTLQPLNAEEPIRHQSEPELVGRRSTKPRGVEPEESGTPASADEEAGHRWINAELEDHDPSTPLRKGETYTLAFGVDVGENPKAVATALLGYAFPKGEDLAVLSVDVESDDFEISGKSRPLRVPHVGPSKGKARFDITPLRDGPCVLTATVHKEGNFVQEMTLTFHVGEAALPVEVANRGRPALAAAVLERRDIGLTIYPEPGSGFHCFVRGTVASHGRLPIQDTELADALRQLRAALMAVVTQTDGTGAFIFQDRIDIPDAERDRALAVLAEAGYLLYRKIFYHRAADAQTRRIGDWLREQTAPERGPVTIQVVSKDFPVPWGLLYVAERWDEDDVQWHRFLGMSHVIEQFPLQNEMATPDGVIATTPSFSLSINLNEEIDAQMGADYVGRQGRYWESACLSRSGIRLTTRRLSDEVLTALRNEATEDQILYLYCHAGASGLDDPGGSDASWLKLSGDKKIRLRDLDLHAPTDVPLAGHPLVFINACESAELSPLFYDGFVPYFMAKGARGVIGTECKTPALFAAEWAIRFFDGFMDGMPLGELFLKLRRDFYLEHGNPLGLLYGVHCDGNTYLKPALPSVFVGRQG